MESSVSEFIVLLLAVAVVIAALLLFNSIASSGKSTK